MLAVGVQGKSFSEVALELNDANQQKNRGKNTEFNSTSVSRLLNQTFKSFIEVRLKTLLLSCMSLTNLHLIPAEETQKLSR